jgi:hypothetical protein
LSLAGASALPYTTESKYRKAFPRGKAFLLSASDPPGRTAFVPDAGRQDTVPAKTGRLRRGGVLSAAGDRFVCGWRFFLTFSFAGRII